VIIFGMEIVFLSAREWLDMPSDSHTRCSL